MLGRTMMRSAGAIITLIALLGASGCRSASSPFASPDARKAAAAEASAAALRAEAMAVADNYVAAIAQGCDALIDNSTSTEVRKWAWKQKIATSVAAYTNATGANDSIAMVDMIVLATLRTRALENHWIPTLLHGEGAQLLTLSKREEADIWNAAERSFTQEQLDELHKLINQWEADHPDQYYIGLVRLSDIAAERHLSKDAPELASHPNSIFSMLYLDPLAGLDPVAAELRSYRLLTERLMYLGSRMPIILGWEMGYALAFSTDTPQINSVVRSVQDFTKATQDFVQACDRTADAFAAYPNDISKIQKDAVDQMFAGVTKQREAILKEVEAQQSSLRTTIADVQKVIDSTKQTGVTINDSTTKTVTSAEEATRRTLHYAFTLAVVLALVLILGIPLALFSYRFACKRWIGPPANAPAK